MSLSEQEARGAIDQVGKIPVPRPFKAIRDTAVEAGQQGVTNIIKYHRRTEEALSFLENPPSKEQAENQTSPIIIDLDGNGIDTKRIKESKVHFDLDNNGLLEKTGWIGGNDAFLALDLNNDKIINNGSELFGNNTKITDGNYAKNGYEALKQYDENNDGKIDAEDSIWSKLVLWQDLDGNGESSENEIIKVEDSGLKSISLNYNESNFIDVEGNAHKQQSTVEWQNGTTTKSADVWFATQLTHTIYTSSVIDQNILVLPNVIGFGNLLNLHDAAQTNVALLDLVETIYQSSNNPNQEDIINLIYEWGNVSDLTIVSNAYLADKVNITSIDPRKLAIIETITGSNYSQNGSRNPGGNAAKILEAEFSSFVDYVYSTFVLEKKYPKLLTSLEIYIYDDGSYGIDFSGFEQLFKTLLTENKINDLNELIDLFSKYVIFSSSISQTFKIYILELYLEYELFQIEGVQLSFLNTITDQDDFILGDQTNNIFKGGSGNDLILGMAGNDILYGDDGHDILIGGEGNDKLYG
ncbi:hypothetical protein J5N55_13385, partial [Acinetobacter haemolyticus]|nr:hypothetical protein [Acinetobacter haemolyticus]